MRVSVEIQEDEIEGDYGFGDGLRLICSRCGFEVEVRGTGHGSVRFGARRLKDECPRGENNFYNVGHWDG